MTEAPRLYKNLFIWGYNVITFYRSYHGGYFWGQRSGLVKVLYHTRLIIREQLPSMRHRVQGFNCRPHRQEGSVLPLCHSVLPSPPPTRLHKNYLGLLSPLLVVVYDLLAFLLGDLDPISRNRELSYLGSKL